MIFDKSHEDIVREAKVLADAIGLDKAIENIERSKTIDVHSAKYWNVYWDAVLIELKNLKNV